MKRALISFAGLSAVLVLIGCNGTVGTISFPAAAPWNQMSTGILSPTDDLVAMATGTGIQADLVAGSPNGIQALVACQRSQPKYLPPTYLQFCLDRACDAQDVCTPNRVIEKRYTYTLVMALDRGTFSSGSVQVVDGTGAPQAGLAINIGNAVGGFDVAAGYSEGLIPGVFPDASDLDETGGLAMSPHWSDFGSGVICPNGDCNPEPIEECDVVDGNDVLVFVTTAPPGSYSGTCGSVPVHLTINPSFNSLGDCLSTRKAVCDGLTGQDRKTCNFAQIGICQAMFNVSSAHNPG